MFQRPLLIENWMTAPIKEAPHGIKFLSMSSSNLLVFLIDFARTQRLHSLDPTQRGIAQP